MKGIGWAAGLAAPLLLVAPAIEASAQFNRATLSSTGGRVGYHLDVSYPRFSAGDVPRGNKGGAVSGTCRTDWFDPVYSGGLPPGMQFTVKDGSLFTGTPRQPGTWRGTLSFNVRCLGGPDTTTYFRTLSVVWNIEP